MPVAFRTIYYIFFCCLSVHLYYACGINASAEESDSPAQFFVFEVLPLLQSKCFSCHGDDPAKIEGGLDLRTHESMLKGGDHHKQLIVSGRPEFSPLYQAITREDPDFSMPPKDPDALTEDEVQAVYSWIVSGAVWPSKSEQKIIAAAGSSRMKSRVRVSVSKAETDHWQQRYYRSEDLWAFRPLKKTQLPKGESSNPIDLFIQNKLDEMDLKPAQKATKEELIKRLYFNVAGLPPSPSVVKEFAESTDEQAFETLVDRLMAEPSYGEKWGSHWLDVVRYADSDGFSNDYARPSAWRYRDYVIRSFNSDKPYNQFVLEQIAGDELDASNPEHLIATGFLRMGPWEHTGMAVVAETRQYFLDDVTNIVGETFLATPLNCARCHDHKYDPIPTRDYYQIQAVFATTQLAERAAPFLPSENLANMPSEKERVEKWLERIAEEGEQLTRKEELAARNWYGERGRKYIPKKVRRKLDEKSHPPRYVGLDFADLGYRKILQKRKQIESRNLERFEPWAYTVYSGPFREVRSNIPMRIPNERIGRTPTTHILKGGSIYAPTDSVRPGILSILHDDSTIAESFNQLAAMPSVMSGRRLAFSKWLTHPDNPLTARVMVNRIWQHHFGKGLAQNPNNFGATGKSPTHPDLLDWLATAFIEHGWSIKYIDRLILTSETYQRSSNHSDQRRIEIKDPDNNYLTYFSPRRLEAEEIRDAMLAASGELVTDIGGIPIRPEIPLEVALQPQHTMGSVAPAYQPSTTPELRNRRSIYMERKRAIDNPMMQVFNQNDNDVSCEMRDASTVVTQAFTLLNSDQVADRSVVMASALLSSNTGIDQAIERANELILLRFPTETEVANAREFILQVTQDHEENPRENRIYPLHVERHMVEEMTGEEFNFTEYLDVYENYIPDVKPEMRKPGVLALADYIAILFSTNEFLYVY